MAPKGLTLSETQELQRLMAKAKSAAASTVVQPSCAAAAPIYDPVHGEVIDPLAVTVSQCGTSLSSGMILTFHVLVL